MDWVGDAAPEGGVGGAHAEDAQPELGRGAPDYLGPDSIEQFWLQFLTRDCSGYVMVRLVNDHRL